MGLEKYQKMRDFGQTPEPRGRKTRARTRTTFVVQKHRASHLHYDFRLEMEGVLKSWAVPKGPSYDPGVRRLAMMTEDHPYEYGSFEGVIPAGNYGAGNVIIWDEGEWEFLGPGTDPVAAVKDGKLTFKLEGKKLHGEWALIRTRGGKGNEWLLLKHRDEWANTEIVVTEVAPLSVVSGLSVEEVDPGSEWESNRKAGAVQTEADAQRARPAKASSSGSRAAVKNGAPDSRSSKSGGSRKAARSVSPGKSGTTKAASGGSGGKKGAADRSGPGKEKSARKRTVRTGES